MLRIVWAKKTFWINRGTQEVLTELSVNDSAGGLLSFIKNCPYYLNDCTTHGIIDDYLKRMPIKNDLVELFFESDKIHKARETAELREKRITELLK